MPEREPAVQPRLVLPGERRAVVSAPGVPLQADLFGPREVPRSPAPKTERRSAPRGPRKPAESLQQTLDFLPAPAPAGKAVQTKVEAVIFCTEPVAPTMLRVTAAAIDAAMVVLAFSVFLAAIHFGGGEWLPADRLTLVSYLLAAGLIGVFYKFLFATSNIDTPGTRWTRMRIVHFDGQPPTREQRMRRLAGGILSLLASGLGLLWSLVDEESLTWHDHISKTFPTTVPPSGE
ncbi:MAG: RDD family protein [Bryobacteraceae bacterium]|nr:RDD family protein [Bryobacteraceae bacterium]